MFCSRRGFKTESRGNDEKQHQEKIRTEKKIKESANLRQSSGLALRIREKLSTQGGLPLNERTSAHGNGKRRQNRRAKTRSRKTHPDFFPTSRRSLHENFPSLRKNRTKHGKNHSHAPRKRIKTRNPPEIRSRDEEKILAEISTSADSQSRSACLPARIIYCEYPAHGYPEAVSSYLWRSQSESGKQFKN